jgi:hypothetical protein
MDFSKGILNFGLPSSSNAYQRTPLILGGAFYTLQGRQRRIVCARAVADNLPSQRNANFPK